MQTMLDIRDLDWSGKRTHYFEEGIDWVEEDHLDVYRSSAYLYGRLSGWRVQTRIRKGVKRLLVVSFYPERKTGGMD